jgi:hypothetical protein
MGPGCDCDIDAGGNPSHSSTQPLGCTSRHVTDLLLGTGDAGTTRTGKNAPLAGLLHPSEFDSGVEYS